MSDVASVTGDVGRLDYELEPEVHADTPERMKALGDTVRLTILDLVLERAMTVTELAARLQRPRGSVAHHVKVLHEAGLLKVVRSRKVRAIEERYYGRTGLTVVFSHGPGEIPFLRDVTREIDLTRPESEVAAGYTFRHARISRERAGEYISRLYALSLEFVDEPRDGDVEYGMYLALFPTNRPVAPAPDKDAP